VFQVMFLWGIAVVANLRIPMVTYLNTLTITRFTNAKIPNVVAGVVRSILLVVCVTGALLNNARMTVIPSAVKVKY